MCQLNANVPLRFASAFVIISKNAAKRNPVSRRRSLDAVPGAAGSRFSGVYFATFLKIAFQPPSRAIFNVAKSPFLNVCVVIEIASASESVSGASA